MSNVAFTSVQDESSIVCNSVSSKHLASQNAETRVKEQIKTLINTKCRKNKLTQATNWIAPENTNAKHGEP